MIPHNVETLILTQGIRIYVTALELIDFAYNHRSFSERL